MSQSSQGLSLGYIFYTTYLQVALTCLVRSLSFVYYPQCQRISSSIIISSTRLYLLSSSAPLIALSSYYRASYSSRLFLVGLNRLFSLPRSIIASISRAYQRQLTQVGVPLSRGLYSSYSIFISSLPTITLQQSFYQCTIASAALVASFLNQVSVYVILA